MPAHHPLPNLTVQHLTYLDAALRAPTWAKAAEHLGVTGSALSQGIAELERRLGVELFTWEGRRRVPVAEAVEVHRYAERVLTQTGDLSRWLRARTSGVSGPLHVGMIDAAAVHHFPDVLRSHRREHPDVDLRLSVAPTGSLLRLLQRGAIDLAVGVDPGPVEGVTCAALLDEPLAVYAPDGAGKRHPASWGPWVTFPAGSMTREVIADAVRQAGAPFEVIAESHQPEVLREMVRLGMGWAVLPVSQAEGTPPLRRARSAPIATRRLVVLRRLGGPPQPTADALEHALLRAALDVLDATVIAVDGAARAT